MSSRSGEYDPKTPNRIAGRIVSKLMTLGGSGNGTEMSPCWKGVDREYRDVVISSMVDQGIIEVTKVPGAGRKKVTKYKLKRWPSDG